MHKIINQLRFKYKIKMDKYILLGLIIRQNLISLKLYMKIPELIN